MVVVFEFNLGFCCLWWWRAVAVGCDGVVVVYIERKERSAEREKNIFLY